MAEMPEVGGWQKSVKGGTPVPLAAGSGRLVVPAPQRPLLPGGCGGLTWWGELSDRGGPSRRRGAWPKPPLSEDCRFLAQRVAAGVLPRCFSGLTRRRGASSGRRHEQPRVWGRQVALVVGPDHECSGMPCVTPLPWTFLPRPGSWWPREGNAFLSGGSRWGDELGGGRRALGEKAFSSDPRGCLGVPEPPSRCPSCARRGHLRQGDCMPLCVLGGAFSPA